MRLPPEVGRFIGIWKPSLEFSHNYDVLTFKSMKGNSKQWNVCIHVHSFYGGLGKWKEILLMLLVCVGNSFVCKCLPVGCLCATYEMFTCGVFVCYL